MKFILFILLAFNALLEAADTREVPAWINMFNLATAKRIDSVEIPNGMPLDEARDKLTRTLKESGFPISLIVGGTFKGDGGKAAGFTLRNCTVHDALHAFATLNKGTLSYEKFGFVIDGPVKKCVLFRAKTTRKVTIEQWRQSWISTVGPTKQFATDPDGMGITILVPKDQSEGLLDFLHEMGIVAEHVAAEIDWPIKGDPERISSFVREKPFDAK